MTRQWFEHYGLEEAPRHLNEWIGSMITKFTLLVEDGKMELDEIEETVMNGLMEFLREMKAGTWDPEQKSDTFHRQEDYQETWVPPELIASARLGPRQTVVVELLRGIQQVEISVAQSVQVCSASSWKTNIWFFFFWLGKSLPRNFEQCAK